MFTTELTETFNLIKNDKVIRSIAAFVILTAIFIAVFFSSVSGLIIVTSYVSGFIMCGFLLHYQNTASVCLQRLASIYRGHFSPNKNIKEQVCLICTGPGCSRHFNNNKVPWKTLKINSNLNDAIEHFYSHILDQFILSWYKNYTNDKTFISELKYCIRYATASVVNRFLELDVGKVITGKLVPCAIKHVDDYLCMIQIGELKNVDVNQIAVDYLGKRLHVAGTNRKNELKYLRYLSASMIERLLPPDNLKCRNYSILLREIMAGWVLLPLMDVLADPNIINSLVILATTYKSKRGGVHQFDSTENVEILHNFSKTEYDCSALASDLKTILKNPQLLYAFMQFLKAEGSVNLLNFCLDIDAFNGKLLMPDLSKRQLEDLHTEALNLHKTYLDEKNSDFIGCESDIIICLQKLLEEGVYNVAKLQTSEPLFKAYDFAYNILENEWMPQFYHSNEFYNYICGSKVTPNYYKGAATSPFIAHGSPVRMRHKKYHEPSGQGAVAKISSGFGKIKGALQTKQPVEGAVYPHESKIMESDPSFVEDILPPERTAHRDMSAWRISIPAVEKHQYGTKPVYVFNINVQRIDTILENEIRHWIIHRRDQDFYTLKSKLIEFHGESEICNSPLPSRRTNLSLDQKKSRYEDFLRKLLEKPSLKGSDLLHTFLTSSRDFTLLVTTSMPIVDLENIYQSVAYKLRKEKGQHLDVFMNTFLNSTGRQKPSKFEWAELGDEVDLLTNFESDTFPKTMQNSVFGDHFGVTYNSDQESSSSSINPSGITEAAFYLLKHIFRVPNTILKLYVAICSVAQQAVESMTRLYIDRKVKMALSQSTLAFLITELEGVIFGKFVPSTAEELKIKQKRAFDELERVIPQLLISLFGKDLKNGAIQLLTILQNPLYNKQLAYNLVDIIVAEMYPELDSSEEFY